MLLIKGLFCLNWLPLPSPAATDRLCGMFLLTLYSWWPWGKRLRGHGLLRCLMTGHLMLCFPLFARWRPGRFPRSSRTGLRHRHLEQHVLVAQHLCQEVCSFLCQCIHLPVTLNDLTKVLCQDRLHLKESLRILLRISFFTSDMCRCRSQDIRTSSYCRWHKACLFCWRARWGHPRWLMSGFVIRNILRLLRNLRLPDPSLGRARWWSQILRSCSCTSRTNLVHKQVHHATHAGPLWWEGLKYPST